MLSCELVVKFQNWTCLWDSTNLKMGFSSLIPVQYIFWTNGYCCIVQNINKIKKMIDWASLRKKIFILRLCYSPYKHKSYSIIQCFSMVDVLGSPSLPQNHYLSMIPFTFIFKKSKIQNSLVSISMIKFANFYLNN